MAKKTLLPKNIAELLETASFEDLKTVFDICELDARGGTLQQSTLAYSECSDELAFWLVDHGADLAAPDKNGDTPLHSRARNWKCATRILLELGADLHPGEDGRGTPLHFAAEAGHPATVRLLLDYGARVNALNSDGQNALERALQRCSNAQIRQMAAIAEMLINAGAERSDAARAAITRIGTDFEFHRASFNPDHLTATNAGLEQLYVLFDVPPVAKRAVHDGTSPIVTTAQEWEDRYQEWWALLVPSNGPAQTVQGEVIRIAGRITRELDGNGGGNWDAAYDQMADAFLAHVRSGTPLPDREIAETAALVGTVKRKSDGAARLCELAVDWVGLNPDPITLPRPSYRR